MSWHRAAILVACGFLLQCTSSTNTSSQQSYNEALRRSLTTAPWCPPRQPSPRVVVPYPYLQTNCPNPRVRSSTNNIITQNNAAGWPEYRIKLPLYMGRPIKTNIIIELPLYMFTRPEQTGAINNAVTSSSSSSSSSSSDAQASSQTVEDDKASTVPPEYVGKEDSAERNPDEIIKNEPLVPIEGNTSTDSYSESPIDNSLNTDQSGTPCDNDSPSPSTNNIESIPTVSVPANEANPKETDDCSVAIPNESIETAPDSPSPDSACIDNTPESIPDTVNPDECELTGNNEPVIENIEKSFDEIQDDAAIEPQPQTGDGGDVEYRMVDDTKPTDYTQDDIITEEVIESGPQPDDETIVTEDEAEFNAPRTDDGTEITSSAVAESEAASTE